MKKSLLLLLLATTWSVGTFAQKGMQGVGGNFAYGWCPHNHWSGMGVKYQYNLTDYIRLEPSYTYFFHHGEGKKYDLIGYQDIVSYVYYYKSYTLEWAAFINAQVFLFSPRSIRPYLIAGIGLVQWDYERKYVDRKESYSDSRFDIPIVFDFGIGLDWRLDYNLSLQIEAKMFSKELKFSKSLSYDYYYYGFNSNIGLTYNF